MKRVPMTLTQKILAHHARGASAEQVRPGEVIEIAVDWTIASELAWNGMEKTYQALGRPPLHDPDRFFLAVDHTVDPVTLSTDPRTQKLVQRSRDFAKEQGIHHFYDANVTILHTKFYRELVQPGQVVLGADSHTSSHGGLGAFAIGLGGADITAAMVLGRSWIEVPEAIEVEYRGQLPFGLGGKEVILRTLKELGRNTVAMERSVEYRGEAVASFTTDTRFTIANMTAELGGLNGIFEPDGVVAEWLSSRSSENQDALYFRADPDAAYVSRVRIDLSGSVPLVAKPFSPDNVVEVEQAVGMPLDGCFIGACTTTEEELVLGALVLEQATDRSHPMPPSPKKLVVPGDLAILDRLRRADLWRHYEKAGFRIGPPGCSMCLGIASERALPGEVWLSSQNRNYENRMGKGSLAYLASAVTVAASSLRMQLSDPRPYLSRIDPDRFNRLVRPKPASAPRPYQVKEPERPPSPKPTGGRKVPASARRIVVGKVQRFGDHVDTDAIIPGEFCHLTDLTEIGRHCFHHVRPGFSDRAAAGATIVVAGEGWGTGSSREQAVWALKGAGIQVVIAKGFAFIHRRNLVNEALPHFQVEDPAFFDQVAEGDELSVDLASGLVTHTATGRRCQALPPSPLVRALTELGGLVPAVRQLGKDVFQASGLRSLPGNVRG